MGNDWQELPAIGPCSSRYMSDVDRHMKRRLSRLVLPGGSKCTLLPALAGVDSLMRKDACTPGWNGGASHQCSHTNDQGATSSISAASSQVSTCCSSNTSTIGSSPVPSPEWHVMLLGRNFRSKTVEETANCLLDALDLEPAEAFHKATCAKGATALVVGTFEDAQEAQAKADTLRSKGLKVQVASDVGVPGLAPPVPPKDARPEKRSRRSSYADVFADASGGESRRMRRSSAIPMSESSEVPVTIPVHGVTEENFITGAAMEPNLRSDRCKAPVGSPRVGPRQRRLKDLIEHHKETLVARSTDSSKTPPGSDLWKDFLDVLHLDSVEKNISPARLEASAILRFLLFGEMGSPSKQDASCAKEQVYTLLSLWSSLDEDGSDRVDLVEFAHFVQRRLSSQLKQLRPEQALPDWAKKRPSEDASDDGMKKFSRRLFEKIVAHLFGKKSCFSLMDLMHLIFLHASGADWKMMQVWLHEIPEETARNKVDAPPVLGLREYEDLCADFKHFARDYGDELSLEELVRLGIIFPSQILQTRREWDQNGNSKIEMEEFCEMMCPAGYRASQGSRVGTTEDCRRVVFDPRLGYWQLEHDADAYAYVGPTIEDTAEM